MWRTSCGERILEGAEAKLFAEALWSLLDEVNLSEADDYESGVRAFDSLAYGQKISVLSIVGDGLLRKDVPPVELTAVLEGGIAAIFEHLRDMITLEIDMPELRSNWRELVVAARKEMEAEEIPGPTCDDLEEWDMEVQGLADCILWDADYDDADLYVDQPPEKSESLRSMAGIADSYYLAIADDLNEHDVEKRLAELRKLCRSILQAA